MVSYLLGTEELDENLKEFILEKSEGVPFFIEELIRSLNDLKIIEKENNRYRITKDIKEVTIPATVQDVIMARVDSLPELTKGLLQTISAVGRESSYDLIKRVTGLAEHELLPHLSALKDSELLYERGIYPQSTYVFKHALTQDVAYDSLLLKRRKEIHEEIGRAMESLYPDRLEEYCELLAYHFTNCAAPEPALKYLELASQKAARVNAMEEANIYFDEAMELLDNLPETEENRQRRISLLVNLGYMFLLLFKTQEYFNLLVRWEPIAKGLKNQGLLGAFYARLGQCEYSFGHFDQSIQTLTKAIQLSEAARNLEDVEYAYTFLLASHLDLGDYDQVLFLKEDALRIIEQKFDPRWYVYTLSFASRACSFLGRWDEASEIGEKALSVAEEYSDNSLITFAAWNLSITYGWKVDMAQAIKYGELAVEKAQTHADIAWAQRSLGWAWCRAGEPEKGIELLINALSRFRAGHFMSSETDLLCFLGEGYWLAGKDGKARQTLENLLEIASRCGAKYYLGWAERFLGEIDLRTIPTQASVHFERSISIFQEIKAENELALAYVGYGRLHKQQNKIAQAREFLMKALEIFKRLGTFIEQEKVRKVLAELPEA
jgi:tetratricopeptide (TPR) repeat protein